MAVLFSSLPAQANVVVENFDGTDASSYETGFRGDGLSVEVPKGGHRGLTRFQAVPGSPNEAWFRYMLSLDQWRPSQSGKLPGFASLRSRSGRGCIPATDELPGWSARMMYRPVGASGADDDESRIGYYAYHLDQPKDCGEIMEWNDQGLLSSGRWYCIEGHVALNDLGESNGVLEGWVDERLAFSRDSLRFRTDPDIGVDDVWMNVYSGGKPSSPESLSLRLDELAVSTSGRIGCPDAFDDDEADPNEQALNRLAELGLYRGCDAYLACPSDPITRGAFVEMIARANEYAPGGDFFSDDDGHVFEPGINAAAAAGLDVACGAAGSCPDDPISRAEAAEIITGAFGLPPGEAESFVDVSDPDQSAAAVALASAGVSGGCGAHRFCPQLVLTRSQAAALVANAVAQDRVAPSVSGRSRRPTLDEVFSRQSVVPQRTAEEAWTVRPAGSTTGSSHPL